MATFRYSAQTQAGGTRSGVVAAESQEEAFRRLKADGLRPIEIRPVRGSASERLRWKPAALVDLLDDLAALVEGGVSLAAALEMTADVHGDEPVGELALLLKKHVQSGAPLEEAFSAMGDGDAALIAGVVAAGQASGEFAVSLRRAADLIRTRLKAQEELLTSAAYPVFLTIFSLLLLVFLFVGVIPSFEPILESTDTDPPFLVGLMLGASRFVRGYGLIVLAVAGLAIVGFRWVAGEGAFARLWSRLWLDGPLASLGRPLVFGSASVFLGMMLAGGVPAADAVRAAAASCPNAAARSRIELAGRRVREGEALSAALGGIDGFPRSLSRMAEIGGEIGVMGVMLARGGEVEQARAIRRITALTRAAGPALVLSVGALIGVIMMSVFFTIASIGEAAVR